MAYGNSSVQFYNVVNCRDLIIKRLLSYNLMKILCLLWSRIFSVLGDMTKTVQCKTTKNLQEPPRIGFDGAPFIP